MGIRHHSFRNIRFSNQNNHLLRSCDGGIEKVFRQKHTGCTVKRKDNDRIFTALTLMDGDSVCVVKLLKRGEIVGNVLIVKDYLHTFVKVINAKDCTNIAVEYSRSRCIVLAAPLDFVIVLYLHYLVALTENPLTVLVLLLFGGGRIESRLNYYVEVFGACISLSGGGDNLNIVYGIRPVGLRQTVFIKVGDSKGNFLVSVSREEEKVVIFNVQPGHLATVYHMRIGNY